MLNFMFLYSTHDICTDSYINLMLPIILDYTDYRWCRVEVVLEALQWSSTAIHMACSAGSSASALARLPTSTRAVSHSFASALTRSRLLHQYT